MGTQLQIPVVYIGFNRPEVTATSWKALRQAAPTRLLLVADGPRPSRSGEAGRCEAVRSIMAQVDWPCEVSRDFSDVNLGCKRRVSSGLNWAFSLVDQAIILEDDCLPSPDFFAFMTEMLERYRDDPRVMMVSGDKLYPHSESLEESYYFSRFGHIWGWATWRRAWQSYDVDIKSWPELKKKGLLKNALSRRHLALAWSDILDRTHAGMIDTWDHQWTFNMLARGGLSVQPTRNLVSNIGFGSDATHTTAESRLAHLPVENLPSPLIHPSEIRAYSEIDENIQNESHPWLKTQVKHLLRKMGR